MMKKYAWEYLANGLCEQPAKQKLANEASSPILRKLLTEASIDEKYKNNKKE